MASDVNGEGPATLSPDDAFSVLGDDTRMAILQTLVEAEEPLAFSELRERVGLRDSGQFNYHLGKLEGHFVEKTAGGYDLREAGRRVVEAVLAGAVTDDPILEPTPIDDPCPHCDTPILVAYRQERVKNFCPECPGHYGYAATGDASGGDGEAEYGYLGSVPFPPAGLQGRTAAEVHQAATTWGTLELLAIASRVCPRCSAPLAESVRICETHETTDGLCDQCNNRHAVQITRRCTNCFHKQGGAFVLALLATVDLLAFLTAHGINPVSPASQAAKEAVTMDYDEEVLSVDPFEARFTFTADGDALTLTVDDDLNVVEATRRQPPETT